MKSLIGVALVCSAGLLASGAKAQAIHPDGADPAPGAVSAYVGKSPGAFYDVEARIDRVSERINAARASHALSPGAARQAMASLRAIKSEAAFRRQRHGGELRDWDRELLNQRLDRVAAMVRGDGAEG